MTDGFDSPASDDETPLAGGTATSVWRVGDTVRRSIGPWTPTVHALLAHLERVGFDRCPRVLGFDEHGREVLTYIEGEAARRPFPSALRLDSGLASLGRLVREYHEAVADFVPPSDAVWQSGPAQLTDGSVICHGDLGPWNTIWRDDQPVALIDFDAIQPAPAVNDLAYLAGHVVPLRADALAREAGFEIGPDRRGRLGVLCEAYGLDAHVDLLDVVDEVLRLDQDRIRRLGGAGVSPWSKFLQLGQDNRITEDLAWLNAHRDELVMIAGEAGNGPCH